MTPTSHNLLIASTPTGRVFLDILPWLLVLVGVAIAGWFLIMYIRRSLHGSERGGEGFTLEDLRNLHRAGELSDEEFRKARQAIIDRMSGTGPGPATPAADHPEETTDS